MFNRFRSSALLLSGLLLAVGSTAKAQNALGNGGFEFGSAAAPVAGTQTPLTPASPAGSLGPWSIITTGNVGSQDIGWTASGHAGIAASEGNRFLDLTGLQGSGDQLNSWGGVKQNLVIGGAHADGTGLAGGTLRANTVYTFSFDLGAFGGHSSSVMATITGLTPTSLAPLSGTGGAASFVNAGPTGFGTFSFSFETGASGSVDFSILGTGATEPKYLGLDNVQVFQTPLNAVPEMPGAAMLLPALLPVGLVLGRKRRKS